MASKSFEESLRDLEKIVKDLEKGDLPLEKALKRFEDGMALSKRCSRMLDETEQKISQLIKDSDGTLKEQEFAAPTPDSASPSAPE